MPPFFDRVHLHQAVSSQAIPALEAIAANGNLHSVRRFERDDPPPYVSSTESEELDDIDLFPPLRGRSIPEELIAIMERPIDDKELNSISYFMRQLVRPEDFYYTEAYREESRFEGHRRGRGPRPQMFRGLNGARRQGVIVRHLVKARWEKLGVWNPKWGFAGRKMQPGDNFRKWTWWWQPEGAADDSNRTYHDARELIARALRLRQNLRRGEHAPVLPRSHLGPDTTAAQAEAFLISRPWFIFEIEVAEENTRYRRLSVEDRSRYPYSAQKQVIKWWKERGDWRDEKGWTGWKWRHESPSPEPEDLAPLDKMIDSPLDAAADMKFTPSEIDELETIELPESEQPEGFWVIQKGDLPPSFPGQMIDTSARVGESMRERAEWREKQRAQGYEPPVSSATKWFQENFPPGFRLFGSPPAAENEEPFAAEHEASPELQDHSSELQDVASPPPQNRRRLRQRQPRDGVDQDQDQDQPLPPPLRRSARIAGMKHAAEPLPQTMPNKRRRGTAAPKTLASAAQPATQKTQRRKARPVPARPPPKIETETRPKRGRGRPRKENGTSTRPAMKKKVARTPAVAGAGRGGAAATKMPAPPRRRGRPRKKE